MGRWGGSSAIMVLKQGGPPYASQHVEQAKCRPGGTQGCPSTVPTTTVQLAPWSGPTVSHNSREKQLFTERRVLREQGRFPKIRGPGFESHQQRGGQVTASAGPARARHRMGAGLLLRRCPRRTQPGLWEARPPKVFPVWPTGLEEAGGQGCLWMVGSKPENQMGRSRTPESRRAATARSRDQAHRSGGGGGPQASAAGCGSPADGPVCCAPRESLPLWNAHSGPKCKLATRLLPSPLGSDKEPRSKNRPPLSRTGLRVRAHRGARPLAFSPRSHTVPSETAEGQGARGAGHPGRARSSPPGKGGILRSDRADLSPPTQSPDAGRKFIQAAEATARQ